jgi:ABC-2 type transport system permease protein
LTGLGRLVRFVVRHDRLRLMLWLVGLGGVVLTSAVALPPVYPDQASRDLYGSMMDDNPALLAFAGPGYGMDSPSIGAILVNEVQLWGALGFALMSIFLLNRHTRAEEDVERADLVRSAVVGRHAPSAAAVAVVGGLNVVLGAVCAIGFVATGYEAVGSVSLAASMAAVGLVFVGVTALAAQVASSGRATLGWSAALLAAAFVVRAIGDIAESWVRWLSPIGWAQSSQAFVGDRWWPLALCLAVAAGLVAAATWTSTRRDIGSGLIPTRPGPAAASRSLTRPLGLAARLHRGSLIGWPIGLFVTGALYGSIGDDVEAMVEENPVFADIVAQAGGGDITDAFFASATTMLALVVSGFAIATVLRLRSEESAGRAELVLAAGISRVRWAASHLVIAVVGTVAILAVSGAGMGLAFALVTDRDGQVARMTGAALVTVPAVLVLIGVTLAVYGFAPRATPAAWGVLAAVAVIGVLAEVLRLPGWVRAASPFHHLPAAPAEPVAWLPLAVLVAVAVALGVAGLAGLRARDLDLH